MRLRARVFQQCNVEMVGLMRVKSVMMARHLMASTDTAIARVRIVLVFVEMGLSVVGRLVIMALQCRHPLREEWEQMVNIAASVATSTSRAVWIVVRRRLVVEMRGWMRQTNNVMDRGR